MPESLPQTPLRQRLLPGLSRRLLAATALALLAGLGLAALQPGALAASAGPLIVSLCLMLALSWFGLHRLLQQRLLHGVDALSGLLRRPSGSEGDDDQWIETGVREFDDLAARLLALSAESRTNQRGLDYVASHDALTGIGNRRYLGERMALALNHLRSHPHVPFSLMLIGLDSFKLVNDGLGHAAGDAALCEVAKRLRALLRPEDSLARLGGDEFALLLYQLRARDAGSFFDKLRAALALPIRLDQRSVNLGVSAGIAEGVVGMTTHDWQRQADLALVAAKREGRNRLSVFRESMQSEAARQLRLEQALRLAIANQDLEVWFQPVVDGSNGNVLGLEALCRWTHEGEAIAPLEFIALAERSGQISGLGRNVLAGTCSSLRSLRKRHPALRCSVNLSVGQFIDGNIEADVVAAVSAAELPMSALRLEITESLVATHESGIVPAMGRLVELGAEFCLDDFGTGFSSLDRLRQLPIRTLKIDRSFITPLTQGDDVMVRHIHTLSHDLGLDTIAEGVEHEEERRRLCEIGCFAMQGYLLARPMPASELSHWLEHRVVRSH